MDWEARFRADDTPWEQVDGASRGLSPAFVQWFNMGFFDDAVLYMPGVGRAPEFGALAAGGAAVIGIDVAPTAVAFQNRILSESVDPDPRSTAFEGNVLTWQPEPPLQIDAVYEQTCLCAMPPEDRPAYAQQMTRLLQPGGTLFALFMQRATPGGPPYHCGLDEMRGVFSASDWVWEEDPPIMNPRNGDSLYEIGVRLTRSSPEVK